MKDELTILTPVSRMPTRRLGDEIKNRRLGSGDVIAVTMAGPIEMIMRNERRLVPIYAGRRQRRIREHGVF